VDRQLARDEERCNEKDVEIASLRAQLASLREDLKLETALVGCLTSDRDDLRARLEVLRAEFSAYQQHLLAEFAKQEARVTVAESRAEGMREVLVGMEIDCDRTDDLRSRKCTEAERIRLAALSPSPASTAQREGDEYRRGVEASIKAVKAEWADAYGDPKRDRVVAALRAQLAELTTENARLTRDLREARETACEANGRMASAGMAMTDAESRATVAERTLADLTTKHETLVVERDAQRNRVLLCRFSYVPSGERCFLCSDLHCVGRELVNLRYELTAAEKALREVLAAPCDTSSGEYDPKPVRDAMRGGSMVAMHGGYTPLGNINADLLTRATAISSHPSASGEGTKGAEYERAINDAIKAVVDTWSDRYGDPTRGDVVVALRALLPKEKP